MKSIDELTSITQVKGHIDALNITRKHVQGPLLTNLREAYKKFLDSHIFSEPSQCCRGYGLGDQHGRLWTTILLDRIVDHILKKRIRMRKKPIFILLICFFISTGSFIFSTELGIKAGIMHSHSVLSQELPGISYEPISEFTGGVFFSTILLGRRICFQPEVWYTKKGFDAVETYLGQEISSIYQITYFEVPLLLSALFSLSLDGVYHRFPGACSDFDHSQQSHIFLQIPYRISRILILTHLLPFLPTHSGYL